VTDYAKLRETAKKIVGVSWITSSPCSFHEFMEFLDKSEKWDKVNEGIAVDGIHTSKGILGELYELRERANLSEKDIEFLKKVENYLRSDKEGEDTTLMRGAYEDWLIETVKRLGGVVDPAHVEEGKR